MLGSGLRLLTLDLTGTVFRFRKPPFVSYQEMAAAYGVDTDLDKIRNGFLGAWKTLNASFPHFGSTTHGDSKAWWHSLVHDVMKGDGFLFNAIECSSNDRLIADALGKDYNFDKVEPIARDLYILYSNPTPYEVFPDAALFLDTISKAGKRPFKLGVITNFDRRIHGVMDALDLSRHFDFLVCSEDAGASKPDPAIFAKAVEAVLKVALLWGVSCVCAAHPAPRIWVPPLPPRPRTLPPRDR